MGYFRSAALLLCRVILASSSRGARQCPRLSASKIATSRRGPAPPHPYREIEGEVEEEGEKERWKVPTQMGHWRLACPEVVFDLPSSHRPNISHLISSSQNGIHALLVGGRACSGYAQRARGRC